MDDQAFLDAERAAVHQFIEARRDVCGEFVGDPVPDAVLAKILHAAHRAPSVGLSQPCNFIVVRSPAVKDLFYRGFCAAHAEAAEKFAPERSRKYLSLELEGIREAPLGVCITRDRSRGGEVVLGRTHQLDIDLHSTVRAVQNFWLAARAEGVGVGWMSSSL